VLDNYFSKKPLKSNLDLVAATIYAPKVSKYPFFYKHQILLPPRSIPDLTKELIEL